jgi:hypothetical protein
MIGVRRPRLLQTLLVVLLLAGTFPGLDVPLSVRLFSDLDGEELAARPTAAAAGPRAAMVRPTRPETSGTVFFSPILRQRAAPEPVRTGVPVRLLIQRLNE